MYFLDGLVCLCTNLFIKLAIWVNIRYLCLPVPCGKGSYYNKTCLPCEKGYYQDMEGQVECKPCQNGQTTRGDGAQSLLECIGTPTIWKWSLLSVIIEALFIAINYCMLALKISASVHSQKSKSSDNGNGLIHVDCYNAKMQSKLAPDSYCQVIICTLSCLEGIVR